MDIDKIDDFLGNINDDELLISFNNLKLFICKKNNPSSQKILMIGKQKEDLLFEIIVIEIKNFRRYKRNIYEYSFFGGLKRSLYFILKDILISQTEYNTKQEYSLSYTFSNVIPAIEDNNSIIIDKTQVVEKHNMNSCVVCYEKYSKNKIEYKLRCNHSICRECFFNIIIHNSFKCPLCRQLMI